MNIYMLDIPECRDFSLVLQTIGKEVIFLKDPVGQQHLFQDASDLLQSLFILPLYLLKDSSQQTALFALAESYEIPILFIYKRSKKLKDPQILPKRTIYESIAIPANSVEVKLKLKALQNISMQLYTARMKERELESISLKVKQNLRVAQNFQQLVLPTSLQKKDIEIQGLFQPSSELSGDLFYWSEVDEGKYGFMIIDVCGKGIHAALISMSIRSLMPGLIKRVKDPTFITKELNKHMGHLFQEYRKESTNAAYFTAFIAYIDTTARLIEYVNNGHPPAIIYSPCNNEVQSLSKGSMPIGLVPDMSIEKGSLHYEAGSRFIIYTDGLSESPSNHTVHRFENIEQEFIENVHLDTSDLLQELLVSRMRHSEINDDICIIAGTLF
ncbi:PP2C family protein-serine/threonine phosphatase [Peribacillus sp. NPDC097675]|uniref:PP2C family protein-serine/threonine phosphatase n=1 Tax=Peribacillus sp. NPDC097675 TaxID=3390618 RepID=UPI003CFD613B